MLGVDGSLFPNSFRARLMLVTAESGQELPCAVQQKTQLFVHIVGGAGGASETHDPPPFVFFCEPSGSTF
jgi:hypothetical protein